MSLFSVPLWRLRCRRCQIDSPMATAQQAETLFEAGRRLGMAEGLETAAESLRPFLTGPNTASRNLLLGRMRCAVRDWRQLAGEAREEVKAMADRLGEDAA